MIGVPTTGPVRRKASSLSARISPSQESSSAASRSRPGRPSDRTISPGSTAFALHLGLDHPRWQVGVGVDGAQ